MLAQIDPYILAFSFVTVAITVWMGFRSAKTSKTASDFFVAGRSVGVGMNASAISGEYLSAASFMGIAGMVMSSGYDALWYPVCYACGYLFLLLFIAGPLRRFGAYTIPDFAEGRFDSPVFRKIAVVFVLFIGFFYTMPQMKGAGTTLAYIFPGLPYWAGVVLVGAVITLNVALGGMKGITLVQAFQYWAKMFAISVPIFVLMAVYGHYGKQLGVNGRNVESSKFEVQGSTFPDQAPREKFSESVFQTTAIGGNSNQLFLKTRAVKQEAARRFGVGTASTPFGDMDISSAVGMLAERHYGLHRMLIAESARPLVYTTKSLYVTATDSLEQREQEVRSNLRSNGVDIIVTRSALVVVPLAKHADYAAQYKRDGMAAFEPESLTRAPLPAKAPADATWLNPFGPLTTKAAKAARTSLHYTGALSRAEYPLAGDLQWHVKQRLLSKGSFTSLDPRPQPLDEWVHVYARLISEVEPKVFGTSYILESSPLPAREVKAEIPDGSTATVAEAVKQLLFTNGITVQRQGKVFRAFPTAEAVTTIGNLRPYALLYTYSLIIAIVCGTAGLPHILVRFYTNPDGAAAKRTTMWVMILIGVFYVFPPVFGVIGRNLLPDLYNGLGAKGTDKIVLELPRLLNEKYAPLGSILSGITCAGAFAAFMSTFSGLLVSMTGALAHDVYGRILRPKSTPEQRMRMFKIGAVLIGGVAIVLGSFVEPLEINFMVGQAFAIAAASYFPLLFMAVWWRKLTMKGAAVGMLVGGVCALVAAALTNFSNLALDKGPMGKLFSGFALLNDFWAAHPLLRILCEQPAIWAVPLAIILMIVVSKLTAATVPSDSRMKMLVLHAPEQLGLKQEYIQEHQAGPGH